MILKIEKGRFDRKEVESTEIISSVDRTRLFFENENNDVILEVKYENGNLTEMINITKKEENKIYYNSIYLMNDKGQTIERLM